MTGRPKPNVAISHVDRKTHMALDVCSADYVYAVLYQDKPFALRTYLSLVAPCQEGSKLRYQQTTYTQPGTARMMARRLNKKFNTDEFSVIRLRVVDGQDVPIERQ